VTFKRKYSKGVSSVTGDRPYRTGYGKPPVEGRFKPGQSGNPAGRRKGLKNTSTLLKAILDRKIEMRIKGRVRLVSIREAILTRFADDALKGNTKSAAFLLQRYDLPEISGASAPDVSDDEEQEIIDAYLNSLKTKGTKA
jgi:hypothetical protein